jgi:hypothetical protein
MWGLRKPVTAARLSRIFTGFHDALVVGRGHACQPERGKASRKPAGWRDQRIRAGNDAGRGWPAIPRDSNPLPEIATVSITIRSRQNLKNHAPLRDLTLPNHRLRHYMVWTLPN